ncbi:hypothetical protein Gotur_020556 [Gossypium turneri]
MAELIGAILAVIKFISRNASKYLKYQKKFTEYVDISIKHKRICVPRRQIFNSIVQKLDHAQDVEDKISERKYLFRSCLGKLVDEAVQAMKEVHACCVQSNYIFINNSSEDED